MQSVVLKASIGDNRNRPRVYPSIFQLGWVRPKASTNVGIITFVDAFYFREIRCELIPFDSLSNILSVKGSFRM